MVSKQRLAESPFPSPPRICLGRLTVMRSRKRRNRSRNRKRWGRETSERETEVKKH